MTRGHIYKYIYIYIYIHVCYQDKLLLLYAKLLLCHMSITLIPSATTHSLTISSIKLNQYHIMNFAYS